MSTFKVYPKEGEPFDLHCERIEFVDQKFVVHGASGEIPKGRAFLSVGNVAAIIPSYEQERSSSQNLVNFRVYLKNKTGEAEKTILVKASVFDADHEPDVAFLCETGFDDQFQPLYRPVRDVYVATSEVVAIIPGKP